MISILRADQGEYLGGTSGSPLAGPCPTNSKGDGGTAIVVFHQSTLWGVHMQGDGYTAIVAFQL